VSDAVWCQRVRGLFDSACRSVRIAVGRTTGQPYCGCHPLGSDQELTLRDRVYGWQDKSESEDSPNGDPDSLPKIQ
jgi:hypothetical protein